MQLAAPASTRAWAVLVSAYEVAVLCAVADALLPARPVMGLVVAGLLWPVRRALRLRIDVERRHLRVHNRWRSYDIAQDAVEGVVDDKVLGLRGPSGTGLSLRGRRWPFALLLEATAAFDGGREDDGREALRQFLGPVRRRAQAGRRGSGQGSG